MNFDLQKYLNYINGQTIGKNIYYIPETESTNDAVWDYYQDEDYLILVTDNQTEGRGRRENKWFSEKFSSLIFSIAMVDDTINSSLISLKAGIAVAAAINKMTNLDVKTKWPNDVMINNKKVSGILIESTTKNQRRVLCVGIGINANIDYENLSQELRSDMTSIKIEGNARISREKLLSEIKFLKAIVDIVKKQFLKLVFVGDPFQLPPPSDICSIFDGSLSTFTLTQIHRQVGGNPVLEKANEFREYIEGIRDTEPVLETNINAKGEGIHVLPHADFVTKFIGKYMHYSAGAEVDIPVCTYTNESAINYNSMIRKAAYFLEDTIEPFYTGERLITNSIVVHGDKTVLANNEVVYVNKYEEAELCNIPGYYVTVRGDYNQFTKSNIKTVFSPKTKVAADKVLDVWKKQAKADKSKQGWVEYYKLKNSLADLRPPFAGTTHKAQGGTFPAVFIDKLNINKCRNKITKARLFYVALTRAKENVYVNS